MVGRVGSWVPLALPVLCGIVDWRDLSAPAEPVAHGGVIQNSMETPFKRYLTDVTGEDWIAERAA